MVNETREEMRRIDQAQNKQYKRTLTVIIFLLVTLVFSLGTFTNPRFMKHHLSQSSSSVVVDRSINDKFNRLAKTVGANSDDDRNMLTDQQVRPLSEAIVDYELGLHWFKTDNLALAGKLERIMMNEIGDNASDGATEVKAAMKLRQSSRLYSIVTSFSLSQATMIANLETLFILVSVVVILACLFILSVTLREMHQRASWRAMSHDTLAAGMWAGTWLIAIFALLAALPMIFDLNGTASVAYFLEISSGIFLNLVICGTVLFVGCAIPWQLTAVE